MFIEIIERDPDNYTAMPLQLPSSALRYKIQSKNKKTLFSKVVQRGT